MQINEAKIFNFGKLQNCSFQFAPGINVIYGENEAGKSTLSAFLKGMLFGMEKGRGKAADNPYRRYEPWHAPAFYSGALRFTVDGKPFYLERNFYYKEKREILRNEADGEELSVACGDLSMLLGGIRETDFCSTYVVPQSGAATGTELSEILAEFYSDAAGSGDGNLPVKKALQALQNKKKELNADLKNEKNAKEKVLYDCRLERELLEREIEKIKPEVAEAERELKRLEAAKKAQMERYVRAQEPEETHETENKGRGKRGGMAVIFLFLGLLLLIFGGFLVWKNTALTLEAAGILAASLVCFFGAGGLFARARAADGGAQDAEAIDWEQEENADSEDTYTEEAEPDGIQTVRKLLESRSESLREKEVRLFNLKEQEKEAEAQSVREREINLDLAALELAAQEIERISTELAGQHGDTLEKEIAKLMALFTGNRYDTVRVGENGKLIVSTEGKEVPPEALSRGTLEQIYLAFRIAVGRTITREERMPVFLDEAFAMYDDRRLKETLRALSALDEQIFIFTCQKREGQLLKELDVPVCEVCL
uniref:ATP-binding protein n=1 Tax=Roseburia sp. TaxID=2049040 RepID=UPI003FEE803B